MSSHELAEIEPVESGAGIQRPGQLVLLAVDNSHFAQTAFEYYFSRIHRSENRVLIFHGVENDYHTQGMDSSATIVWPPEVGKLQELQDQHIRELKELYERKMEVFRKTMTIDHEFIIEQYRNKPELSIIHAAQAHKVELIVMGSRGMGVVRRTILGSISDYVLHHADIPVLICHI